MADIRTTGVLDDFQRAAENPLDNGTWDNVGGSLRLFSPGHVRVGSNNPPVGPASYWSVRTFDGDVEVWGITGGGPSAFGDSWYLALASSISPFEGYGVRWSEAIGDNAVQVRKWTGGTGSIITDYRGVGNDTPAHGDLVLLRTSGSDVEYWWSQDAGANWTMLTTDTDTSYRSNLRLIMGLGGSGPEWLGFGGGEPDIWMPEFLRRPWEYQGNRLERP